ncbi:tRNA pseudouridine synthase D [Metschnikowia bicuspidata var. bicuspidata NRRL YB-4993]|uniref:tRNA pseudouridine synthase D n=1 Tax=Metschnikowia bicuspidata var. bicuspidata NRRL YB-4993 TaxID=869754 RepID=A0A1A0H9S0_9ASCO|nr:tRNA pseudouridine synthase D [Metschnikowia bicuspidata var. bicuspidata NRRL YB-4993]OBA20761.1 tRNA pseudouridine synthase D [Metschnikowia bicuspidata var. bicuspidata NRRL YB-4993]
MENTAKRTAGEAVAPAPKRVQADVLKQVKESDVGITQYINEGYKHGGGFYGTIKQRYSDFQVFEIDLAGNVVHLTDLGVDLGALKKDRRVEKRQEDRAELQNLSGAELEKAKAERQLKKDAERQLTKDADALQDADAQQDNDAAPKYTLSEEDHGRLLEHVSAAELQQIEALFGNGGNMETASVFGDKARRTQLHQLLRVAFQGKLETITSPQNTIRIALAKKGAPTRRANNNHVDADGVVNYGLGPHKPYLHFTVYKENRETMEVASLITKFLRVPNKSVKYSGTKDRRGVTCQRFSVHNGKVARVCALNNGLRGSVLGSFRYENSPLDLGDLQGNEFVIAIKNVRPRDAGADLAGLVRALFDSLRLRGFINYYGLQRFGTFSISTHVLGIHLLKDDWRGAAELILAEQDRVVPDSVDARRVWAATGDAAQAARLIPRRCTAELAILNLLAKELRGATGYSPNLYFRALMQIPRNLRLIYVHAYQSYVWNLVASKRIELFGLQVQAGDLVMAEAGALDGAVAPEMVDGVPFAEDVAGCLAPKARALTPEDVASGRYSIYDVVLPSPGYDVVYPANPQLMAVYEAAMAKDGLDPHKMARRVKEFSLAGSYRPLMGRAHDVSFDIVRYHDDTDALVRTDLEILTAAKAGQTLARVAGCAGPDAPRTAVVLRMRLGVSCYATMALREFMKTDTAGL